jgi:hypothetical protein
MSLDASSSARNRPLHISVVALPESILSPLIGLYEVFNVIRIYASYDEAQAGDLSKDDFLDNFYGYVAGKA